MIRTALFAVLAFAAATPALAFQAGSAPAPKTGGHFTNYAMFAAMTPDAASEPYRDHKPEARGPMVVYDVSKGRPAARLDMTSPRDNPFLAQPERRPASDR